MSVIKDKGYELKETKEIWSLNVIPSTRMGIGGEKAVCYWAKWQNWNTNGRRSTISVKFSEVGSYAIVVQENIPIRGTRPPFKWFREKSVCNYIIYTILYQAKEREKEEMIGRFFVLF